MLLSTFKVRIPYTYYFRMLISAVYEILIPYCLSYCEVNIFVSLFVSEPADMTSD